MLPVRPAGQGSKDRGGEREMKATQVCEQNGARRKRGRLDATGVHPALAAVPPGAGAALALPPLAAPSAPVLQAVAVSAGGLVFGSRSTRRYSVHRLSASCSNRLYGDEKRSFFDARTCSWSPAAPIRTRPKKEGVFPQTHLFLRRK
jgi:hypothetical protein